MQGKPKIKKSVKVTGLVLLTILLLFAVSYFLPQSKVREAILGSVIELNTDVINNIEEGKELPLAGYEISKKVSNEPQFVVGGYPWNGQTAMMASAGGNRTKVGSLMEANNVNFRFIRKDGVEDLQTLLLNQVNEMEKGNYSATDMSAHGIISMGDGVPSFIATTQHLLDSKFGGKYHVQAIGAFGMSYGEDGLIAPINWKNNPKELIGKVISVVYGDGNWVVVLNYCHANGLPVNPDHTTYDPDAVNLYPSADDDFIKSAEELIASQLNGFTVKLDEIKNGRRTGKKVSKSIDAMASWTPADKMVFDKLDGFTKIISTKEFNNQMPTTLVVIKEWADKHPHIITNFFKSVYVSANQIKQYDSWAKRGGEANAESFGMETPKYWYDLFKGEEGLKNGVPYQIGGSRVLNLADAKQYYGLGSDGNSRYKVVYDQVSKYLAEYKPFGFDKRIPTYEEAVNLSYIQSIDLGMSSGVEIVKDYSKNNTDIVASGSWRFNFAVGSAELLASSNSDLEKLYGILMQAEDTKINIIGHTDSTGNYDLNKTLSKKRAESVQIWLINKGLNYKRIQMVDGYGSDQPIGDNNTSQGKAQNRRTDVTLLK